MPSSGRVGHPCAVARVTSSASRSPSRSHLDHRRCARRPAAPAGRCRRTTGTGAPSIAVMRSPSASTPQAGDAGFDPADHAAAATGAVASVRLPAARAVRRNRPGRRDRRSVRATASPSPWRAHADVDVLAVHRPRWPAPARLRSRSASRGRRRPACVSPRFEAATARRCLRHARRPARSPAGRSRTSPTAARRTAAGWRTGPAATIAMRLPTGLPVERLREIRRGDVAFALVEHLDVAAERDRGDHVLGAVAARARTTAAGRSRPRSAAP